MAAIRGSASAYDATYNASGGTIATGAFSVQPVAGDDIVVFVAKQFGVQVPTVTDNASGGTNTYTQIGSAIGDSDVGMNAFYCRVVNVNADLRITATYATGEMANCAIVAFAISDPRSTESLGVNGGALQATASTATDGTTTGALGTPAEDGNVYVGMGYSSSAPDNFNAGTGFTSGPGSGSFPAVYRSESLVQATASDIAVTFTQDGGGKTLAYGVAIRPAAGSPPPSTFIKVEFRP